MKIPKNAKKVFEGVIFDVYQWEQEMFDGSKETFEMLKRPNTLQVIAVQGDKILIGEEEQPYKGKFYSLFGGRQEDESPLEGIKRELLEETGLESSDWELYKSYDVTTKLEWQVHIFIARDCKKVAEQKLEAGEKISVKAISFDEFLDIVDSNKYDGKELAYDLLRLSSDRKELAKFKKLLFK